MDQQDSLRDSRDDSTEGQSVILSGTTHSENFAHSSKHKVAYVTGIGGLCIRISVGGSVANAKAPKVSIIKFTHSNCIIIRIPKERLY